MLRLLECSWGEKEGGDRDSGHLCGGEKQEKGKRKKRKETCMDENEMKERIII